MNKFLLHYLTWLMLLAFTGSAGAHESVCEESLLRYPIAKLEEYLTSREGLDGFYNIRIYAAGLDWQTVSGWEDQAKAMGVNLTNIRLLGKGNRIIIDFMIAGRKENLVKAVGLIPHTSAYWIAGDLREAVHFEDYKEIFLRPISELQISSATARKFQDVGIEYVGELASMTTDQLDRVPRVGSLTLGEVENALRSVSLKPGLRILGWPPPELPSIPLPDLSPADLKIFLELPITVSPIEPRTKKKLLDLGLITFGDIVCNPNGYFHGVSDSGMARLTKLFNNYGFRLRSKIEGWPKRLPKRT